ncbi:MAG: Cu(I)-responsive transcriptional regulator [Neisseriaceae bacterium]|nr:Cu(I)-responsive transcriptional regulator [Neisseriaceae bacterium]MBP6861458.1 Cu(I)-responsive transcriptional regulator [Neisseriaceae bacterium]
MNISQVAALTQLSAKMIRRYEELNLLPDVPRTEADYRVYQDRHVAALSFIKRARDLGFSLKQIEALMSLWHDQHRASADVKQLAQEHIRLLEDKARQLQEMANTLKEWSQVCRGDDDPNCPILNSLAQACASHPN